jgi:hypothetical protein
MADYDVISELYRITGVRNTGSAFVFPKTRVVRKIKKKKEESQPEDNEGGSSGSSEEKGKGIDIKV